MADAGLLKYITDNRAAGYTDEAVKQALVATGWDASLVDQAFTEMASEPPIVAQPVTSPPADVTPEETSSQTQSPAEGGEQTVAGAAAAAGTAAAGVAVAAQAVTAEVSPGAQVAGYVKKALDSGMSDVEVKFSLKAKGWDEITIMDAFQKVNEMEQLEMVQGVAYRDEDDEKAAGAVTPSATVAASTAPAVTGTTQPKTSEKPTPSPSSSEDAKALLQKQMEEENAKKVKETKKVSTPQTDKSIVETKEGESFRFSGLTAFLAAFFDIWLSNIIGLVVSFIIAITSTLIFRYLFLTAVNQVGNFITAREDLLLTIDILGYVEEFVLSFIAIFAFFGFIYRLLFFREEPGFFKIFLYSVEQTLDFKWYVIPSALILPIGTFVTENDYFDIGIENGYMYVFFLVMAGLFFMTFKGRETDWFKVTEYAKYSNNFDKFLLTNILSFLINFLLPAFLSVVVLLTASDVLWELLAL